MSTSVRELQMALLDMLVKIDELCKKYEINYSLSSGTVLGAVRHGGFIPWDDDLDLMFVREEYEKFLRIPNEEFQRCGFTLQKAFTKEWPMFFSKVRKNGTTFIEKYPNKLKGAHQGIYIDIFPVDNLYNSMLAANVQWNVFHLLAAKCLDKRGYRTTSLKKEICTDCCEVFARATNDSFCGGFQAEKKQRSSYFLGSFY